MVNISQALRFSQQMELMYLHGGTQYVLAAKRSYTSLARSKSAQEKTFTGQDTINGKFPLGDLNPPKKRAITISLSTRTVHFQRTFREMKITTIGAWL